LQWVHLFVLTFAGVCAAGSILAVLINVRLHLTPYVVNFQVTEAPLVYTYQFSLPIIAVLCYLGWLHVLVPLTRKGEKRRVVNSLLSLSPLLSSCLFTHLMSGGGGAGSGQR
jgi:hypothetical protein